MIMSSYATSAVGVEKYIRGTMPLSYTFTMQIAVPYNIYLESLVYAISVPNTII